MFPVRTSIPLQKAFHANSVLILANIIAFILITAGRNPAAGRELFFIPKAFLAQYHAAPLSLSTYGPLFSSIFLHSSLSHLVLNMWSLHIFGRAVEESMGAFRYILFYLSCGILANITQILSTPELMNPLLGASGAIAGIMGGFLFTYPRGKLYLVFPLFILFYFVEIPACFYLITWFGGQLYKGIANLFWNQLYGEPLFQEKIAWWVHIGGFWAGLTTAQVFRKRNWRRNLIEVKESVDVESCERIMGKSRERT